MLTMVLTQTPGTWTVHDVPSSGMSHSGSVASPSCPALCLDHLCVISDGLRRFGTHDGRRENEDVRS
jgi:hypothetical protein